MIEIGPNRDGVRENLERLSTVGSDPERRKTGLLILGRIEDPAELDRLLLDLKNESERFLGVDPHRSLGLAESLIALADLAALESHRAFGLTAKADALRSLGRYEDSRALFVEAGRSFSSQGDDVGWARTRTGLLLVSQFLGRSSEVLTEVPSAHAILIAHGQWLRAAGLMTNAGLAESELGRYDEALARFDDALALFERAALTGQISQATAEVRSAKARGNKALVLTRRGDFRSALALLEEARSIFSEHGEQILVLSQDTFIADVYAGVGNYTRALHLYSRAFSAFERADLAVDAAYVALKRVECYLRLNLDAVALDVARDAVTRFESADSPTELAKARFYSGLALARLGEHDAALSLFDAAATTFEAIGAFGYLGVTLVHRAALRLARDDCSAARSDAERARTFLGDLGMVVPAAQAALILAEIALALEQLDDAMQNILGVLSVASELDLAWLAHEAHHLRARVARERGSDRIALTAYRASIASIERVQVALANELQTRFLGDKLRVYNEAIDLCLKNDDIASAFDLLERAKSRSLVDYLARHPDVRFRSAGHSNPELAEQLDRLREDHHWHYHRLHSYGLIEPVGKSSPGQLSDRAEVSRLQAVIRDREKQIGEILERQALEREAETTGVSTGLPTPVEPRRPPRIPSGTVMLEYFVRDDRSGVFVWTDSKLSYVALDLRATEIRRRLNSWNLNLSATARAFSRGESLAALAQNANRVLEELGRALLGPVADAIRQCDRVIVVPHGVTHLVPFGALRNGGSALIESMVVSVAPSASILGLSASHRARDRTSALVVANSDGGRLGGAIEEAQTIARILPGAFYLEGAATRDAFIKEAPRYGIIHLAAHGESRLDNPTFAHLKLADGQLNPIDVFNLDLEGALVTLSGCETGRTLVAGGDELIGLSRGFLYAGASTLVQSLWRVEDRSTSRLMDIFYRAIAGGRPAAMALRDAQLTLREERPEHPFFWAPFQVVGDPGYLESARRQE